MSSGFHHALALLVLSAYAPTGGPAGAYLLDNEWPVPADRQMNQYTVTPFDVREYDANGNLTYLFDGRLPGERYIAYDYRNRMAAHVDSSSGEIATYSYDALGRRIGKTVTNGDQQITRYFHDGWREIEERDGGGATQATYVYGNYIDEALAMSRGGADYYYHADDLFGVTAVTGASGAVVERYEYEDYGRPLFFDPSGNPIAQSAVGNPLLFTGRRYDPETDWYHYRTRYLDPLAGRFTTRDVIGIWGDDANLGNGYTYVGGNPASWVDPFGLEITQNTIGNQGYFHVYENHGGNDYIGTVTYRIGEQGDNGTSEELTKQMAQSLLRQSDFGELARNIQQAADTMVAIARLANPVLDALMSSVEFKADPGFRSALNLAISAAGLAVGAKALDNAVNGVGIGKAGDKAADALAPCARAGKEGIRYFESFAAFKRAMGPAGEGKVWHHIVEKSKDKLFGARAVHNTENIIALPWQVNRDLNRLYSSIRREITGSTGITVREWLKTKSYEFNRSFGLKALENVEKGIWP